MAFTRGLKLGRKGRVRELTPVLAPVLCEAPEHSLLLRSGYLFAQPSFLRGAARILDLGATMDWYNESRSPEEADALAIYIDWLAVGDDLNIAMHSYHEPTGAAPTKP